jgi:hypothetical protein
MAATHHQSSHEDTAVFFHGHAIQAAIEQAAHAVRGECPSRVHLVDDANKIHGQFQFVYCVAYIGDLVANDEMLATMKELHATHKRFLLFPNLGPESISEVTAGLDVRSPERIHTPRFECDNLHTFCRRFMGSICSEDSHRSILDAWWEPGRLVIRSGSFERMKVPISALPRKFREAPMDQLVKFGIDEDGDMISWPELDIDMGWEQFEQAVNPEARLRANQKSDKFNAAYGHAIRILRESKGVPQNEIDGLDARHLRRIEQGEQRATHKALSKLADAHNMDLNAYMNELSGILDQE